LLSRISRCRTAVALYPTRRNMKRMKKKREKRRKNVGDVSNVCVDFVTRAASIKRMMVRLASARDIKGQVVSYESNETRHIKSRCK